MSTSELDTHSAEILDIRPLQPTIGAEIHGIDLAQPINDAQRDALRAAVIRHKVLFFRDQTLTPETQARFAAQFGPLYTHPTTTVSKQTTPDLSPIHKIAAEENAKYDKLAKVRRIKPGEAYHSDTSWRLVPTWGAVLAAVDCRR